MDITVLIAPVNNGHSYLTRLKLRPGARIELADDVRLRELFAGSGLEYPADDFRLSVCRDTPDDWSDLVLTFENTD